MFPAPEYGMLAEGDTGRLTFKGLPGICRLSDSFYSRGTAYAGKIFK